MIRPLEPKTMTHSCRYQGRRTGDGDATVTKESLPCKHLNIPLKHKFKLPTGYSSYLSVEFNDGSGRWYTYPVAHKVFPLLVNFAK